MKIYENPSKLELIHIAKKILDLRIYTGKAIGVCGNGGSSAQASHLAGELIPLGIPCIPFNDPSVVTSIGNDVTFNRIFDKYITAFRELLDTCILLTTSGNSDNIRFALDTAFLKNRTYPIKYLIITGMGEANNLVNNLITLEQGPSIPFALSEIEIIRFSGDTPKVQEKTLEFIHYMYKLAKGYTRVEEF